MSVLVCSSEDRGGVGQALKKKQETQVFLVFSLPKTKVRTVPPNGARVRGSRQRIKRKS